MDTVKRKNTRKVMCRNIPIGGGSPISVQSMTNTDTRDVDSTLEQIKRLQEAGCQIIRLAVPDMEAAEAFGKIRKKTDMPLVADIHFDYRLAVAAIEKGADKVRINPGNIGSEERVRAVIDAAREHRIPVRIGVNSGSVERDILARYGGPCAEGLVESAVRKIELVESMDFDDIVVSVKASDVVMNYQAYMLITQKTDHPLHIGVTESGDAKRGTIKSAAGLGALLLNGVGDTLRVSLTGDPVAEIPVARELLKCTGDLDAGINLVSCPTCSRCHTDMPSITERLMKKVEVLEAEMIQKNLPGIDLAVMGCAVNGPGEASHADIGVACGDGKGVIFKKGKIIDTVKEAEIETRLLEELKQMIM